MFRIENGVRTFKLVGFMGEFFISRPCLIFIFVIIAAAIILTGYTANALGYSSPQELYERIAKAQGEGNIIPPTDSIFGTQVFDTQCIFNSEIIPKYNGQFLTSYCNYTFDKKVEPNNPIVNNYAIEIVANRSGNLTIAQICSIYDYLVYGRGSIGGWSYINDPRGSELVRYANNTINEAKKIGCSGVGDCDDFAILMSSLIESIGGSTRIIRTSNSNTAHAYTEVYLGKFNLPNNHLENVIEWLMKNYDANNIYTHIHREIELFNSESWNETIEVWLNLDWKEDEKGKSHPGGPFFEGEEGTIYFVRASVGKRYPLALSTLCA